MCLLLGATGVGKTLLLNRLQNILQFSSCLHKLDMASLSGVARERASGQVGVGTNLTDLILRRRKITVGELGGCMEPIWPKYYVDSTSVIFVVDCSNVVQISSSCVQLLSVLSAEPLQSALCSYSSTHSLSSMLSLHTLTIHDRYGAEYCRVTVNKHQTNVEMHNRWKNLERIYRCVF
ncbi:ADP-ribosylation factor-like protein 16 [Carassius gibelio]|uniref:ADP-ribosylation factor-like protein 16 n=1 Tax=Carassius gibelio TaxID=101364 RepID=UPI002277CD72|nr:ADP-ribosylation factor-like protein 16 [Carassius gibelio]